MSHASSKRKGPSVRANILDQLRKQYDSGIAFSALLSECAPPPQNTQSPVSAYPLDLKLKLPRQLKDLAKELTIFQNWSWEVEAFAKEHDLGLQYRDQSTRAYGKQRLPVALIIPTPETHADVLSCSSDFERTRDSLREISVESAELLSWSVKHHAKILSASEDISALLRVYIWRKNNPDSRPYIRALNLEGVHTKLIERNAKLLSAWFDTGLDADWLEKRKHGRKFTDKYGFSTEERRIRMRYLFPADSPFPGISDIQLYQHECSADLASSIHSILIVENHQSFLSLPPVSDVLAVDGGGYAAARLMNIPWFHRKRLIYWGDCDAHGLDILGKLRKTAPNLKSVCMDSDTFKRYIGYSTLETTGMLPTPDGLLPSEEKLFALLHDRALRSQTNRLEQELIPMEYVLKQLNTVLSTPVSTKH